MKSGKNITPDISRYFLTEDLFQRFIALPLFRLISLAIVVIFLAPSTSQSSPVSASKRYGIWVEAEGDAHQATSSLSSMREFLEFIREEPFTDLYIQVYRRGRAWFPSMLADDEPFREALRSGTDPLRDILVHAHRRGIRVHAWINVLRIKENPTAPAYSFIGEDGVLKDNIGNSLFDYSDSGRPPGEFASSFQLETPAVWLDPSSSRVRAYLREIVKDIFIAYPDLDGLHFDMIRYPFAQRIGRRTSLSLDFGYGGNSEAAFTNFGKRHCAGSSSLDARGGNRCWNIWRRKQVTEVLKELRSVAKQYNPDLEVSAAVLADRERAHDWAMQDWSNWLADNELDSLLLMSYSSDVQRVARQNKYALSLSRSTEIQTGLGAWKLLGSPATIVSQSREVLNSGSSGVVLFSYSNLNNESGKRLVRILSTEMHSGLAN